MTRTHANRNGKQENLTWRLGSWRESGEVCRVGRDPTSLLKAQSRHTDRTMVFGGRVVPKDPWVCFRVYRRSFEITWRSNLGLPSADIRHLTMTCAGSVPYAGAWCYSAGESAECRSAFHLQLHYCSWRSGPRLGTLGSTAQTCFDCTSR
jgi:hypothetical protein